MASRSLNKVLLIGNLTRDPELRYTPQGTAVSTFGIATNRSWTTEDAQKHDEVEFHNIVTWNRLAEICVEYLKKGKQVYIEGRLSTREWEGQDGQKRRSTEVVASEVIFLGSAGGGQRGEAGDELNIPDDLGLGTSNTPAKEEKGAEEKPIEEKKPKEESKKEEPEDIPF
ncbi:MAG: single-stranded DNA-binding protein [bacterium]|nr:single-stranded DNA-binding protein [bacterium]